MLVFCLFCIKQESYPWKLDNPLVYQRIDIAGVRVLVLPPLKHPGLGDLVLLAQQPGQQVLGQELLVRLLGTATCRLLQLLEGFDDYQQNLVTTFLIMAMRIMGTKLWIRDIPEEMKQDWWVAIQDTSISYWRGIILIVHCYTWVLFIYYQHISYSTLGLSCPSYNFNRLLEASKPEWIQIDKMIVYL